MSSQSYSKYGIVTTFSLWIKTREDAPMCTIKINVSDDEGDGLMEMMLQPPLRAYESKEDEYD